MDTLKKRKITIGILIFAACALVLVPVFLTSDFVLLSTSTPKFCASCHEHTLTVKTWKNSSHGKNEKGMVASCKDCHLPPFEDRARFCLAKVYHGTKDVVLHYLGPEYDRQAMKKRVCEEMPDERCLRCHGNLMNPQDRGARLAHSALFHPKPGMTMPRCMDCHDNLVHNE